MSPLLTAVSDIPRFESSWERGPGVTSSLTEVQGSSGNRPLSMTDVQMLTYFIRTFVNSLEEYPSHLMLNLLGCNTCSVTNTHILLVVLSSLTPRFPGIQVIHTTQNSLLEYSSYLGSSLGQNYTWLHHFCLPCEVYSWCMGRTHSLHSCH